MPKIEVLRMATLAELKTKLAKYESALDKALAAEEYSVGGSSVKRAQVAQLEKIISDLESRIARRTAGNQYSDSVSPKFIPRGE